MDQEFEVHIFRAYLCLKGEQVPMTKAIAKQFPIRYGHSRSEDAIKGAAYIAPICKVNCQTIDSHTTFEWLILINTPEEGLIWTRPFTPQPSYVPKILEQGGWIDELSTIPTVILF